jgi:subtilisin family serine protease
MVPNTFWRTGMKKSLFNVPDKASVTLASVVARRTQNLQPTPAAREAGFAGSDPNRIHETDLASVIIEADNPLALDPLFDKLWAAESVIRLDANRPFYSARVGANLLENLIAHPNVQRIQSKKLSVPTLDAVLPDIRSIAPAGANRLVPEDGTDVLIGIVDSGFDLSHPMFLDGSNNLRVEGLLDQVNGNREYTSVQLAAQWGGGSGPGRDDNGHGTHVASIAGGTRFQNYEGVAPGARFLLVRTDFSNTDEAVNWIFRKANGRPCVINMSLGHHFGSHDGTEAEERFHRAITGPGKIIVISAGNERNDSLHIGGRFYAGQAEEVVFDVTRRRDGLPFVTITLWHDQLDSFDATLVTPSGQLLGLPAMGTAANYQTSVVDIEIALRPYIWSNSTQIQISLSFKSQMVRDRDLKSWKLRLQCRTAVVGRLDGWMHNAGYAIFRNHPLVETNRTVGLSATGDGCIAVASHVTRNSWTGDIGANQDNQAVIGRTSSFSSLGPTRDGRWKPDISAPGQYVTAALADRSELSAWDERALVNQRLLTIEGTSMAAPVITGIVALLLQKNNQLKVEDIRRILGATARRDAHTGPANWDPAYGLGKIDVQAALAEIV